MSSDFSRGGPGRRAPFHAAPRAWAAASGALACTLSLLPRAAAAQELLLREVPSVFAASGFEQSASDAPSSVSVITATDIERFGWRTLAEALGSLPGFHTSNDLVYDYVGVRGLLRPGDWNGRILLLVDGQRVNENVYGQAALGQDALVDLGSVERIEVVRGPGSSLYGASAVFAVVDVTTKQGRDYRGWQAEARAGSQGTRGLRLGGGQREGGLEYALSLAATHSDGTSLYFPQLAAQTPTAGRSSGADALRTLQLQGSLRVNGWSLQAGAQDWHKQVPTGAYATTLSDPRNAYQQMQRYLRLGREAEVWDGALLRLSGSINSYHYWGDYITRADGGASFDFTEGHWGRLETVLDQRVDERTRLKLGADFQRDSRMRQLYYSAAATILDDLHSGSSRGFFVQLERSLAPHLRVNAGLRTDRYSTFGSTTSPRLGLIWQPAERHALKLLQGTAYRAPNAFELWYTDGGATQRPNPALQPERIRTTEAVWEAGWSERWQTSLSLYHNVLNRLIDVQEVAPNLLQYANGGSVRTTGVEGQIDWRLGSGLETRWSLSWQDSKAHEAGSALSNSPRLLAKGALMLQLGGSGSTLALEARSTSSVRTLQGERLPGCMLLNATLNLPATALPGWRGALSVYNALDRHAMQPAGQEHLPLTWLPQPGRTLLLRLEKSL
ncbi:TonB-dependent receptor plug domain-containing protein [Azohydromonas lata]|uniref:TonB-dependent receptor plug domain-containing protein n=1 Tax=Azohydromonas lata TaxID=45677 RepID=UPI00083772B3|nr:TonB-dependent receptor [Azohydromonas lata]